MKNMLYHGAYLVFRCLPECWFRKNLWGAFCKFGFLGRAPDEWYWKLTTYILSGEPYGLPGKGGGINSVIRWMQMNWHSDLFRICADKYAVREFVRSRIGDEYLVPLCPTESSYWTDPKDIDLSALPEKFVLKLNNGSAKNLFVKDKRSLDWSKTLEELTRWMDVDFTFAREYHYRLIPNKIICERMIETPDGKPPRDYKLMCTNGEMIFVWVDFDRFGDHRRNFYDPDFNRIVLDEGSKPQSDEIVSKPKNWDEMVRIAKKLSEGIPMVRVDLYNVDGRIYFGELTFTSDQGTGIFKPLSQSRKWASKVDLSPFLPA